MTVFVDTSALYAILDRNDKNHGRARKQWDTLLSGAAQLVTTNYVVVESFALVQHRLGMDAVRVLQDDVLPVIQINWVDARQHFIAVAAMLAAGRRMLSLVDCVSFVRMREDGIQNAFAFDAHFSEQGFAGVR